MTQVYGAVKVGKLWRKYQFRFPYYKRSSSWICRERSWHRWKKKAWNFGHSLLWGASSFSYHIDSKPCLC